MTTWVRTVQESGDFPDGSALLATIPVGSTLLRTRFSWGFYLDSGVQVDMRGYAANLMVFGLVTTIGDGTETVPNARTEAFDFAPPTQRWIWWESRGLFPAAISAEAGVIAWRDTGPQEPTDSKAQVLATGIPSGDQLHLWASWAAAYSFSPDSVNGSLWVGASILYNP